MRCWLLEEETCSDCRSKLCIVVVVVVYILVGQGGRPGPPSSRQLWVDGTSDPLSPPALVSGLPETVSSSKPTAGVTSLTPPPPNSDVIN